MYRKSAGTLGNIREVAFTSNPERAVNRGLSSVKYAWVPVGTHLEVEDRTRRHPHAFALRCVRASSLFTGLTAAAQLEVAESAVQRSFSSRQIIFREDDPSLYVDVIGSGSVKLTRVSQEGCEVILRVERVGSPITDLGDTGEKTHGTSAHAIRGCCLASWEAEEFSAFSEKFPVIHRNIAAIIRHRLRAMELSFCDVTTARVPQRLARLLLRLTQDSQPSQRCSLALSREEMAQMIGTSLFTISRLLSEWAERHIVYVNRDGVTIDDLRALTQLSEVNGTSNDQLLEPKVAIFAAR